VLAEAGTEPGVITAALDLALADQVRARIPSLSHDRQVNLEILKPASGVATSEP
jgi:predicted amidohydrolase